MGGWARELECGCIFGDVDAAFAHGLRVLCGRVPGIESVPWESYSRTNAFAGCSSCGNERLAAYSVVLLLFGVYISEYSLSETNLSHTSCDIRGS